MKISYHDVRSAKLTDIKFGL